MESTGKREKGRRGTERTEGLKKIRKNFKNFKKLLKNPLTSRKESGIIYKLSRRDGTEGTESGADVKGTSGGDDL